MLTLQRNYMAADRLSHEDPSPNAYVIYPDGRDPEPVIMGDSYVTVKPDGQLAVAMPSGSKVEIVDIARMVHYWQTGVRTQPDEVFTPESYPNGFKKDILAPRIGKKVFDMLSVTFNFPQAPVEADRPSRRKR